MKADYSELHDAVVFVSDAFLVEHTAMICRSTGEICFAMEDEELDEIPEDAYDSDDWVPVPEFRDIGCGTNLVHEFVAERLEDDASEVHRIFRCEGAYGRFKHLLAHRGLLEDWYQYETNRQQLAIRDWCQENGIELEDGPAADAGAAPAAGASLHTMFFPNRIDDDVTLTLLTTLEAEPFRDLVHRNRDQLRRWLGFADRYESVQDALSFARDSLGCLAEGSALGCLVWYGHDLAGWVELLNIDHSAREAEIGFWLGRDFEGKGIARRAADAMIEHAFTSMHLSGLHANVKPGNSRCCALLERLGFALECRSEKLVYRLRRESWVPPSAEISGPRSPGGNDKSR